MTDFRPRDTRLIYALRRAHLAVEARKQERLRAVGILPSHYAVLINVWAHPGTTGAELARHLGVSPQNVANLVAKLVARGFLVREPHPEHTSVLELRLTESGADVLVAADAEVSRLDAQVVSAMGASAAATLTRRLAAIADQPVDESHSIGVK